MNRVLSALEAAELIDRFLDGTSIYPQEWNDFVEAGKVVPQAEPYRRRCYDLDPLVNCPGDRSSKALGELKRIATALREI